MSEDKCTASAAASIATDPLRQCVSCGETKRLTEFYQSSTTTYCRACQKAYMVARRKSRLQEDPIAVRLEEVKNNASKKGMDFDLDREAMQELLAATECACCSRTLDAEDVPEATRELDRVDNSTGYVKGNVFATCFRCNRMKRDLSLVEARLLVAYMQRRCQG
jgi:hypothetical protein